MFSLRLLLILLLAVLQCATPLVHAHAGEEKGVGLHLHGLEHLETSTPVLVRQETQPPVTVAPGLARKDAPAVTLRAVDLDPDRDHGTLTATLFRWRARCLSLHEDAIRAFRIDPRCSLPFSVPPWQAHGARAPPIA